MSPEEVVETQSIASLRIPVERGINKMKNFHIWGLVLRHGTPEHKITKTRNT